MKGRHLGTVVALMLCLNLANPGSCGTPEGVQDRELANLAAMAKLLGYVRYFHPSDEAAAANWDIVAIEGMERARHAKNAEDLAKTLELFFKPLAPTLKVHPSGKMPKDPPPEMPKEATKLMAWRHLSVPAPRGPDKASSLRIDLKREAAALKQLPFQAPLPDPATPFVADLGGGVSCRMPLAVYADDLGTLPRGDKTYLKKFTKDFTPSGKDWATRMAAVALAWNGAQHFFPYFDVVKVDWPAELRPALHSAAAGQNDDDLAKVLRRMLAKLDDGHVTVVSPNQAPLFYPPMRWDWIEGRLTIVRLSPENPARLRLGDVVLKIDGLEAEKVIEEHAKNSAIASPNLKRRVGMVLAAAGPRKSSLKLEVQTGSMPARQVILERSSDFLHFRNLGTEPRPAPITEVKPGIWYIDVDRAKTKDFEAILPQLKNATGLIYDVRGYPQIPLEILLGPLLDKKISGVPVHLPVVMHPDRTHLVFIPGFGGEIEPRAPRLRGKVVFLTDARAISAAETLLAMVKQHQLGVVIGAATAGANGNIRAVKLPANFTMQFTGIKVVNFDGSTFHGRGVIPDRKVARTRKAIDEDRDEILEEALKVIDK